MKRKLNKKGMTLIEVLVAIAIIAILAAGLYSAGTYADKKAKIIHTESTIEMLSTALEQYHDFYGKFPFLAGLTYDQNDLQTSLGGAVKVVGSGSHKAEYSSSEALCYFLNRAPDAKKILGSINSSLLTNKDLGGVTFYITINLQDYPLMRIVDSWGKAFRYTYASGDNFPVITSAGPDKKFDLNGVHIDDITSR